MNNVKLICEALIETLNIPPVVPLEQLGPISYIREFRTLGVNLPRACGKTTYLCNLVEEEGNILVGPDFYQTEFIRQQVGADYIHRVVRLGDILTDRFAFRLPVKRLLFDEISDERVFQVIAKLEAHNLLSDDFYILMLGTL
jgi:hypothetical protein